MFVAKEADKPAEPAKTTSSPNDLPVIKNKKTYHARLGLARASSKNTDDLTEAKKYYNEVIDIAPDVRNFSFHISDYTQQWCIRTCNTLIQGTIQM